MTTQSAMIWGASGGIGRALVQKLAAEGWSVAAVSRQIESLEALTEHVMMADPSDDFQVGQAVLQTAQDVGEINLWIYAAGDIVSSAVADQATEDWQRILAANLTGAFITTRHSLALLADDAHLIYIGAYHERLQLPGLSAYAAAKAGLHSFTVALAKEQRKRRVTLVRVGAVDTPLWDKVPLRLPKHALESSELAERIVACYADGQSGVIDM